jgi:hypothetical protein
MTCISKNQMRNVTVAVSRILQVPFDTYTPSLRPQLVKLLLQIFRTLLKDPPTDVPLSKMAANTDVLHHL